MGNKSGFIEKLKLCMCFMTNDKFANILTTSCDVCKSTNLKAYDKSFTTLENGTIEYSAKNKCLRCGAIAEVKQRWKPNVVMLREDEAWR